MAKGEDMVFSKDELEKMEEYWRAANYLSVGQIYLLDNPLLKEPLTVDQIKPRLLGHFGTVPGLNFLYLHLNRIIRRYHQDILLITGPGHGAPAILANTYLEGSYSELYPYIGRDEEGLKTFFRQFSFPGGIPSHTAAETPGSIHEGGELGYSLMHAYGAAFDNPDLLVACIIGDGEAETGPLATSWHSNKFLNPRSDGAVLPILHLNGYKIAEPTILARISHEELQQLFYGYGYKPYFVEGNDSYQLHEKLAHVLDQAIEEIRKIQEKARVLGSDERPRWPMIVFRTPKGWTSPMEGSWRSHQVPLADVRTNREEFQQFEKWMKSYRVEELFDEKGRLRSELEELAPQGQKRMGLIPYMNGGALLKDLHMPSFKDYALTFDKPGKIQGEATRILGTFLRDVMKLNREEKNFRLFGPDETASNRLGAVFEATERTFMADILPTDDHLSPDGRVMEVLSEHLCQGWLEGYLLTGRHGLFSCYEAFIHIIDSMFNQHAKWLKVSRQVSWRRPIASLNYLLTSHVWRQDHNGFSHQDPGFIDHVVNKKADTVRVYFPPDANTLLSVTDHCLRSRHYVNVIVAGKQSSWQWLDMDAAVAHAGKGIGIWQWASHAEAPDVVIASAGDVPTLEALAAVSLIREEIKDLKVRFVNVIDLMTLTPEQEHPHGLSDHEYNQIFPIDTPVIFAFHGYPKVIHRLIYKRANAIHMHVHGYKEEGTTTTPFDMTVLNELDRFHLLISVAKLFSKDSVVKWAEKRLDEHEKYIRKHGEDMPEIQEWQWKY